MTVREAAAAYYRSQFLNSVLPGGDARRRAPGIAHRTVRSVVVERVVGQAVQIALAGCWSSWSPGRPREPSTPVPVGRGAGGVLVLAVLVLVLVGAT